MKVLMVSDARNIHTKRWASSLSAEGVEVILYSITLPDDDFYDRQSVRIYADDVFSYKGSKGFLAKLSNPWNHLKAVKRLKDIIRRERPDILHAHYATSYGLVAALTGFHPFIISVWGSDVYDYAFQSAMKGRMVRFILGRADRILSTSHVMATQTRRLCGHRAVGITPFGVNTGLFRPNPASEPVPEGSPVIFGTVKTLSHKYGIDLLIRSFAEFVTANPEIDARLVIAGEGRDRKALESLAGELGLSEKTSFPGRLPHESLPDAYNAFDVAVFLSREESFGVSVIEAMACGKPVIVSDAEGFTEIVRDGVDGIIVPREDAGAAASAMKTLALDREMREECGRAGRVRVQTLYEWKDNVRTMTGEYNKILGENGR